MMRRSEILSKYVSFTLFGRRCLSSATSEARNRRSRIRNEEDADLTKPEVSHENQYELIERVVAPWSNLDYSKQLERKRRWCAEIIGEIRKKVHGPIVDLYPTIPSPTTEEYRNKDEFSIGPGVDGDPKTVGFYLGNKGKIVCVRGTHLRILKRSHLEIAEAYETLMRESQLPPCIDFRDGGFWRQMTVRSNTAGDTMATILAHPKGASSEEVKLIKKELKDYWSSSGLNLSSLYFQLCPHTRCTAEQSPFNLLLGEPFIYERIKDYEFRISPDSFFQINVSCARYLYDVILHLASPTHHSTLLDLCCGTGTLSILASEKVRGCIGIELNPQAIKDAESNARNNLVTNCTFIHGRIEDVLPKALKSLEMSPDIIAVLNPGRGGINRSSIRCLRKSAPIKRVVYVSCKADNPGTLKNLGDLCWEKLDGSPPFTLTRVQPVDMFPHTKHCETVFLFER